VIVVCPTILVLDHEFRPVIALSDDIDPPSACRLHLRLADRSKVYRDRRAYLIQLRGQ
jgi:hypothetical protein